MLNKLSQKFQQISRDGWTLPQNVGAVIATAEAQGWLLALVKRVRGDTPDDPGLRRLASELVRSYSA